MRDGCARFSALVVSILLLSMPWALADDGAYKQAWALYWNEDIIGLSVLCAKQAAIDKKLARWLELQALACARAIVVDASVAIAEKAYNLEPKNAHIAGTYAYVLIRANHFVRGLSIAKKALELAPTSGRSHVILGLCYMKMGRNAEAAREMARGLELAIKDSEANLLATQYYSQQLDEKAILACYDRAVAAKPTSAYCVAERGSFKRIQGDLNGAVSDTTAAIKLYPGYIDAYQSRSRCYQALGRYPEAIADITVCIKRIGYSGNYCQRGECYAEMRRYPQAIADFSKAISLENTSKNPDEFEANAIKRCDHYVGYWIKRAKSFQASGKVDRALADLNKVLRARPESLECVKVREECYAAKGMWKEALADLNILIDVDPDDPHWRTMRAEIRSKMEKSR